jgi:hypothetical protein
LAASVRNAGNLLAACDVGVLIAIVSAHGNRTQIECQAAAVTTNKTGNHHTQQITEAAVMQNRNYNAEGTCGQ